MTILIEGLNRIRDMIYGDIDKGQLGTGNNASTENDTGLQTEDSDTLKTTTNTTADKQINFAFTLSSTEGTTGIYTEFELQKSSTTVNYDRVVFTGISWTKNGTEELTVSKRYFIRRV